MIIAEISVVPLGTNNPSISSYVKRAILEIKKLGLKSNLTAMGTIVESKNIDDIFLAIKKIHEALFDQKVLRLVTTIKIDERRDKEGSVDQKI